MVEEGNDGMRRLTRRGAATRARMIEAASDLVYARGIAATTLDDVIAASGSGKSQLYHHFADKEHLIREVVRYRAELVLAREEAYLGRVNSLRGLERWKQAVVERVEAHHGAFGCELGSLAAELSEHDDEARNSLAEHFAAWEAIVAAALTRMRDSGVLRADADPVRLATGIVAALEGGHILAQAARDAGPMAIALTFALDQVKGFAADRA